MQLLLMAGTAEVHGREMRPPRPTTSISSPAPQHRTMIGQSVPARAAALGLCTDGAEQEGGGNDGGT